MKRRTLCVALATLAIVATHATQSIRTPVQDTGEGDEFVISFPHGIIQLNPIYSLTASEAQIYTGIYEGLVSYHPRTMEPVPASAQRWEVSEDGLTYTFRLRENARYWNGDPVVAAHFRDTWFELIDPETDAAYNFLFDIIDGVREYRRGELRNRRRVGIRAVNDRTLEVRLRKPATHFIQTLAHHAFVPVHPSVRDQRDWSDLETIPGNGPYRVSERSDRELVLERNEQYWDVDEVAIPRIRIIFTEDDDDETVTQRFNRGEIDWVTAGIDFLEVQFAENIVINPLFATIYYFMRSDVEPFSDSRVRRALALLLPWDRIRDPEILLIPTDRLVPSIPRYPMVTGITEPNRDEALALLEEAGYSLGVRLPTITIHIHDGIETMRVATLMREAWEEALEVDVDIVSTPYQTYFDALGAGDFTVGTVSWIGDFADPLTFLQMWITDSNVNDAGFSDEAYDDLIDQSMFERGRARFEILGRAEEMLLQSGTVLPVSHSPSANLINLDAVDGWFPNPLDIHPLRYLRFSERALGPGVIRFDVPGPRRRR